MNLDERTQLRQARFTAPRQPWGAHTRRPRRAINWWALVLPAGLAMGALLSAAFVKIAVAWVSTL
jgi:hypothetical protein